MRPRIGERRRTPSDVKLIAPSAPSRRILLVEENQDIREMLATALQGQGHRVDHATTPAEGIDLIRKGRYDLVVAHYGLPGQTAAEMLQAAGAEGLLKTTPTLVVTAHPDPQGVDPSILVRKPLDLTKFLLQVQRIFASGENRAPFKDRRQAAPVTVELALYVNKVWVTSARARENLDQILEGFVRSQVVLRVFDVAEEPLAGEDDQVVFTPTLVKRSPPPRAWVVGDLSDHEVVASLLDMAGVQRRPQ
jgi:circadian clock protein KaiB